MTKVFTKLVYQTYYNKGCLHFELIEEESFNYDGLVCLCKGASSSEKAEQAAQAQLATEQASFYNVMTKDYSTQFASQQAILQSIQAQWSPILAAGPGQYGYTPAQDTNLRTQATEATASQFQNASKSFAQNVNAQGGGNQVLPSGAVVAEGGAIAAAAASQEAAQNLAITQTGYQQGLTNFQNATNAMSGVGIQLAPVSYSSAASSAGGVANQGTNMAFNEASTINTQNQAASFAGVAGGILGSVAGDIAGDVGGNLGTKATAGW